MNSHSTLWYPYTDDHIDLQHHQQLYNHTTLNTDTPTRVPNTNTNKDHHQTLHPYVQHSIITQLTKFRTAVNIHEFNQKRHF